MQVKNARSVDVDISYPRPVFYYTYNHTSKESRVTQMKLFQYIVHVPSVMPHLSSRTVYHKILIWILKTDVY